MAEPKPNRPVKCGRQDILQHATRGIAVHLFVRSQKKRPRGGAAPFVYCGDVAFVDWRGEKPITVQWKLSEAVPSRLWAELGVQNRHRRWAEFLEPVLLYIDDARMTDSYAAKGSQRWLQVTIDRAPHLLDGPIRAAMGAPADVAIEWLSPLRRDRFIEYRDGATFTKCGVELSKRRLDEFWPQRGPTWDGLARSSVGDILLVEAKAHIPEIVSPRSRATEPARGRIANSMREVQLALAPKSVDYVDWTSTFYQYANRVAHLYFLRQCNGVRAHLVNVYFLNAHDVNGPSHAEEWQGAIKVVECCLGLGRTRLTKYMHKVFVDARPLVPLGMGVDV